MWTVNQTQPLATTPHETSWIHPELLKTTADVAERHILTGTQTLIAVEPDEDGDFHAFLAAMRSALTGEAATANYVLRDSSVHAGRIHSTAEALAEMAHAAAFGDTVYRRELVRLVGQRDADILFRAGAKYL